jgi:hypothetical protein
MYRRLEIKYFYLISNLRYIESNVYYEIIGYQMQLICLCKVRNYDI